MRSRVREVVIYFKFHENRSRGLVAVGGRKSPSPIDQWRCNEMKVGALVRRRGAGNIFVVPLHFLALLQVQLVILVSAFVVVSTRLGNSLYKLPHTRAVATK